MPIDMKLLVFFLRKCVRTFAKTMVVDRKNEKALALLYFASGPQQNTANSSVLPTEFAAEPTTKMNSRRQIRNLNFSPSAKKTTEYSFELFLSINKIDPLHNCVT